MEEKNEAGRQGRKERSKENGRGGKKHNRFIEWDKAQMPKVKNFFFVLISMDDSCDTD